ncbi:HEAT repeat domain-containing protein [Amycolatopsis sp. cg9]|uniref:HEAT repeat domain-containing protein n=1 Tax=Amycolatopsis sp. cg9 TaxID=3238801 RepID=UPI0035232AA3
MNGSPYQAMRARLAARTVKQYLRPVFRVHTSGDDSGERLRFGALLDQLPAPTPGGGRPRPKTWLVTGGAGSGKSTAVLRYAMALLDRDRPCVVVDNQTLREHRETDATVADFARGRRPAEVEEKLWKARVKQNRVVFLVDAVNELEREFAGTAEWKFLWHLLTGSHGFTVLATSRTEIDPARIGLREFQTLSIEPLGERDIEAYLGMRVGAAAETLAEIRSSDLLGVASNPFMLSLLTDWLVGTRSTEHRKIPRSRAELLRATVVRPGSEGRFAAAEQDAAERGLGMEAALCAAALAVITGRTGSADFLARDVTALLGRVWDDAGDVARTVKAFLDTQMVAPDGDAGDGRYSLIHPAFVDFGLALAWQGTTPPPLATAPEFLDRCLGDWVGLQADPDGAVLGLLATRSRPLPPELLVDVLLANRSVLGDAVRATLWRQLGKCFTDGRQTRDRLAGALASLPPSVLRDGVQHGLLRTLNTKDPDFAESVSAALWNGSLDAQTLQRLRQTHRRSREAPAQQRPDRDEAAAELRREWLRLKKSPLARRRSANWLGSHGGKQDVDALQDAMAGDQDAAVRGACATALGRIGFAGALPALGEALADPEAAVRGSAANALGLIGHLDALDGLLGRLGDEESNVRGSAASALGAIAHPRSVPALVEVLADPDAVVRRSAANALGLVRHPDAIGALLARFGDPDDEVRGLTAKALGRIGHVAAHDGLVEVLRGDPGGRVRGSAAEALGRIGDRGALEALVEVLHDKDEEAGVVGSAAHALGLIGDAGALDALVGALAHPDAAVRGSAANALGRIGDPAAFDGLLAKLEDSDTVVRSSASNALGRIGDPRALDGLTRVLAGDCDEHTRGAAAEALGRIKAPGALAPLVDAVRRDPDDGVRGSAAHALGHLGDNAAADTLRATIRDPGRTYLTRRAATSALAHLDTGDEEWITVVADRLKFTARTPEGRALRGAIVDLVARREITPGTKKWLVGVIHKDNDPMNRTAAIEGLARAGKADAGLIEFVIGPAPSRPDKRLRDSDAGVLGVAAAAVVRAAAERPAYTESLLPGVVNLLAQKNCHWTTVLPPLAQLRLLPLPVAGTVVARIVELLGDTTPENPHLESALAAEREILAERKRVLADLESLTTCPEAVLAGFREDRKSRFEVTAPASGDKRHVALLTAVPVETKALLRVLAERGTPTKEVQRDGRYYDVFELTAPGRPPVRVVTSQATDQGGQAAAASTRELLSVFRPDLVLLVGVCGGFGERGVALGDVLLAREVFDYGPEKVRPGGGGDRPQVYRADGQLLRLAATLDSKGRLDASLAGRKLLMKDFASGEKVIAWRESDLRARLLGLSVDIGGVETEAHGVLHTVWETFKGREAVGGAMLKCVSDLGDEEMAVDKEAKQAEAACRAARVALDLAGAFHRADG